MTYDLLIVGGGIVGLATALEAVIRFPELRMVVLEKEQQVAAHQTGHNSGVIHSGLYYKPGSLKAKLCVEGAAAMVEFCRKHGVAHEVCGKVVVATSEEELPRLEELYRRGIANGVPGIRRITADELREYEPHAAGLAALHVPTTGITDYGAVTQKYAELVRARGGEVVTGAEVLGIVQRGDECVVNSRRGEFHARFLMNCAGLHSDRIARMAGATPDLRIIPFRGEYYVIAKKSEHLVRGLIYPVPDPSFPFLGVHYTRRVAGGIEAGPNAVLAFKREGYRKTDFDLGDTVEAIGFPGFWRMAGRMWRPGFAEYYRSLNKSAFTRSLQKLTPEIQERDLSPGGSGVRAQAVSPAGKLVDDFRFVHNGRMIHVLNVPSPAATASLMIAREIMNMAAERFALEPHAVR